MLNTFLWLIHEQQWHKWQILLSILCAIFYRHLYRFHQHFTDRFVEKNKFLIEGFILYESGNCQFAGLSQQLSSKSQINPLGYWLIFQKQLSVVNVPRVFVFTDSLSEQDNARVARVIRKLRHHPN